MKTCFVSFLLLLLLVVCFGISSTGGVKSDGNGDVKWFVSLSNKARQDIVIGCAAEEDNFEKRLQPGEKIRWGVWMSDGEENSGNLICALKIGNNFTGYFAAFPPAICKKVCKWKVLGDGSVEVRGLIGKWTGYPVARTREEAAGRAAGKGAAPAPSPGAGSCPGGGDARIAPPMGSRAAPAPSRKPGGYAPAPAPKRPGEPPKLAPAPVGKHGSLSPAPSPKKPADPKLAPTPVEKHRGIAPAPSPKKPAEPKLAPAPAEEKHGSFSPAPSPKKPADPKLAPAPVTKPRGFAPSPAPKLAPSPVEKYGGFAPAPSPKKPVETPSPAGKLAPSPHKQQQPYE